MSGWWLCILLLVGLSTLVNSKFDLEHPIRLARCRASCLYKMHITRITDLKCEKSVYCSQCWKACVSVKGTLCNSTDCGPGCLEACHFHTPPTHLRTVPLEEVLTVNHSRVSWPTTPGPSVYVVMADGSQLHQTLDSSFALPPAADPVTVRVLVVDWRGLTKVLAPRAESPVDQALRILRILGLEQNLGLPVLNHSRYDEELIPLDGFPKFWRLKVDSIHHRPPLVLSRISWRHLHHQLIRDNRVTSYLVTWSDGGVLAGNLLTNSPTVILSLLPDTIYRIQVSMLDSRFNLHSHPLVLDTHLHFYFKPSGGSYDLGRKFRPTPSDTRSIVTVIENEGFEGMGTMFFLFIGLIIAIIWRFRLSNFSPKSKLDGSFVYTKMPRDRIM